MKRSVNILFILVVGILLTVPAYAQTGTGVIVGKVIGRDGMPLANAILSIERMNSQNAATRVVAQRFEAKTGRNGSFSVNGLPPGGYQVILFENGKRIMGLGESINDVITVADGREGSANFDMRKGPPPAAEAAAAAAINAPAPSKEDLARDRAAIENAQKNKTSRDKAFKAGLEAYTVGVNAEVTAKDDEGRALAVPHYEEAVKQFQLVVSVDPKQDVAFANLGNAFNKLKKYDEAAAAYQKAIELKPKEAAYFNNLGLALGGAKKMDEGKAAFEAAAVLDPAKGGSYFFNEGAMYNNNQDYPKAVEAFKKCVVAEPNNKACILQEALSYFSTEDSMKLAEPLLTRFLTLNPSPGDAETAKAFLEAIHTQGPSEFKSDKAIAEEKKAADAAAKNQKPAPAKPAPAAATPKKP